jgi:hypothetical protein
MSKRNIKQLKEFLVRYSDLDGSSRGAREYLRESIVVFANQNPQAKVSTEIKRSRHPFLRATYCKSSCSIKYKSTLIISFSFCIIVVNGNSKTIGVKNLTPEEIDKQAQHLRNQIGVKVFISHISSLLFYVFYIICDTVFKYKTNHRLPRKGTNDLCTVSSRGKQSSMC